MTILNLESHTNPRANHISAHFSQAHLLIDFQRCLKKIEKMS